MRVALDLDRLPLVTGATWSDAAASGEEYELIVTAPATLDSGKFEDEFGVPLTAVGRVEDLAGGVAGGAAGGGVGAVPGVEAYRDGKPVPLPRGHSHFSG